MSAMIERAVDALESIAQSLKDANATEWGILIASMGTVGVGIGSLLLTRRQIRLSEERQNNEQFERMRPWITIREAIPLQVIFQNNQAMGWERYLQIAESSPPPVKVKFGMQIVNTGLRPARNLKKIDFGQNEPITRNDIEVREEEAISIDLGVNQSYYDFFEIPWEMYDMSFETPIYFALRISYDNGRTRSFSGAIYMVIRHQSNVVAIWYT